MLIVEESKRFEKQKETESILLIQEDWVIYQYIVKWKMQEDDGLSWDEVNQGQAEISDGELLQVLLM